MPTKSTPGVSHLWRRLRGAFTWSEASYQAGWLWIFQKGADQGQPPPVFCQELPNMIGSWLLPVLSLKSPGKAKL